MNVPLKGTVFTTIVLSFLQCSPSEFYSLVKHLSHVYDDLKAFSEMASSDVSSELLLLAMKEVMGDVRHGIWVESVTTLIV